MYKIILYFTIYSFLGWVCECLYCGIPQRKFINRGFLNGPVCPVYGFGAMFVIYLLSNFKNNIIVLFILSFIVTSVVEYITSYLLEKLFNLKWWDYSHYKFNIHGRVCLLNSTLFGLLSVVLIEIVNPFVVHLVNKIPYWLTIVLSYIIVIIFIIDIICTVISLLKMKGKLIKIHGISKELKDIDINLKEFSEKEFNRIIDNIKERYEARKKLEELRRSTKELKRSSLTQRRILRAFPDLGSKKHHDQIKKLRELLEEHKNDRKNK